MVAQLTNDFVFFRDTFLQSDADKYMCFKVVGNPVI